MIGADTSVVLEGEILGKPEDEAEARTMLTALRGRSHRVVTGVTVSCDGMSASSVTSSDVAMREYTDAEMERYIESGEPFDKAGGYAIQDREFAPVSGLTGCYLNVVGFPLCEVMRLMSEVGVDVNAEARMASPRAVSVQGVPRPSRQRGGCRVNILGMGPLEVLVIALIAFILLGPQRMVDAARLLGKATKEVRRMTDELPKIVLDEEHDQTSRTSSPRSDREAGEESAETDETEVNADGPVAFRSSSWP